MRTVCFMAWELSRPGSSPGSGPIQRLSNLFGGASGEGVDGFIGGTSTAGEWVAELSEFSR